MKKIDNRIIFYQAHVSLPQHGPDLSKSSDGYRFSRLNLQQLSISRYQGDTIIREEFTWYLGETFKSNQSSRVCKWIKKYPASQSIMASAI